MGPHSDRRLDDVAFKEDTRKPLAQLIAEKDEHRKLLYKVFRHKGNGQQYQLIMFAFDERTNEMQAVYGLVALSWLRFTRPMSDFLERFEIDTELAYPGAENTNTNAGGSDLMGPPKLL